MDSVNNSSSTISSQSMGVASPEVEARRDAKKNEETSTKKGTDFGTNLQAATQAAAHLTHISPQGQQAQQVSMFGTAAQPGKAEAEAFAEIPGSKAGKPRAEVSTSAEKNPLTQRSAASTNAGVTIAGPKPWGSEWVFEEQGGPDPHAYDGIKTLFGSQGEDANLRQALTAAMRSGGAAPGGSPASGGNPPSQSMLSRGDAVTLTPEQNAEAKLIAREWLANRIEQGNLPSPEEMADARAFSAQIAAKDQLGGISDGPRNEDFLGASGAAAFSQNPALQLAAPLQMQAAALGAGNSGGTFIANSGSPDGLRARGLSAGVPGSLSAQPPVWSRDLSGAEFLGTMNAVRGTSGKSGQQMEGNDFSGGSNGQGGRPDLRVFQGGLSAQGAATEGEILTDRRSRGLSDSNGDFESSQLGNLGANSGVGGGHSTFAGPVHVEGQVTQGAMAQERLSSDALIGVSGGIRNLSQQGGGEMRLKLRPENLGELHLRVVTQGNDVGLRIQASDERSKKILEESLTHLKESLASHNLNLGKVEVSVAQQGAQAFLGGDRSGQGEQQSHQQQQQQHSGAFQSPYDWGGPGQDASRGGRQNQPDAWDVGDQLNAGQVGRGRRGMNSTVAAHVAGVGFQVAKTGADAEGRIDVRA